MNSQQETDDADKRVTINSGDIAERKIKCVELDSQNIADVFTGDDVSYGADRMYCASGDDLATAFATEKANVIEQERMAMSDLMLLLPILTPTADIVKKCLNADRFVSDPAANTFICENISPAVNWPNVTTYEAQWGGCDMEVERKEGTFSYCAQSNSGTVIQCSQNSCALKD